MQMVIVFSTRVLTSPASHVIPCAPAIPQVTLSIWPALAMVVVPHPDAIDYGPGSSCHRLCTRDGCQQQPLAHLCHSNSAQCSAHRVGTSDAQHTCFGCSSTQRQVFHTSHRWPSGQADASMKVAVATLAMRKGYRTRPLVRLRMLAQQVDVMKHEQVWARRAWCRNQTASSSTHL